MSVAPAGGTLPALPRVPVGGVLTPRAERMIRLGSAGAALVIAVSAMVLSYAGLHDLALDAQVHPRLALLVPIMVDGLQFVGSLGVVYSTLSGLRSWYPWLLMGMGVTISAWGNWQAAPGDLTAKLLHAAAPVILALVLEELLRVMRHKVHLHAAAWQAASAEPASRLPSEVEVALESSTILPDVLSEDAAPIGAPAGEAVDVASAPAEMTSGVESGSSASAMLVTAVPTSSVTEGAPHAGVVSAETVAPVVTAPSLLSVPKVSSPSEVEAAEGQGATAPTDLDSDGALPPYPSEATFKEQVKAILAADPNVAAAKIARVMGKDPSYTRKIVRDARAELDGEAAAAASNPVPLPRYEPSMQTSRDAAGFALDAADPFAAPASVYATR